ncbi:MAG: hypothetical protein C4332_01955 [Meiothermus sp.]
MRYAAFLRGVNLGKHNRLPMADLRGALRAIGLEQVSTYRQTGNVLFDSDLTDKEEIARRIEALMPELGCTNVAVMVRSAAELGRIVKLRPFPDESPAFLHYVSFLRAPTPATLPPARAHEILLHTDLEVFSRISQQAPNATAPNSYLEAKLKVPVTTRYWEVVRGIYGLIQAQPALEGTSVNHKL